MKSTLNGSITPQILDKHRIVWSGAALLLGATLCASWHTTPPASAAPASGVQLPRLAQAQGPTLTVVAEDGVKNETLAVGKKDYGAVDSMRMAKLEHDFLLRNDTKAPVTVARLQAACGCTSVLLGEGQETSKTLAPGESVKVRISVDITRFRGTVSKAVRAYAPDNTLLATMEISANIQGPVSFSTRQVDFGTVDFGKAPGLPLTVSLSPSVPAATTLPRLVSTNPHIVVIPATAKNTATSDATPKSSGAPTDATVRSERHYTVSVSPKTPIGQLSGMITFDVPVGAVKSGNGKGGTLDPSLVSVLQTLSVAITGEVVGRIAANPNMVIFGNAKEATRQVTLTSASAETLKKLKVSSANKWITARILPATPDKAATSADQSSRPTAILEVTLSPDAPVGALETQVHVVTADGEDLSVPILADVQPRA